MKLESTINGEIAPGEVKSHIIIIGEGTLEENIMDKLDLYFDESETSSVTISEEEIMSLLDEYFED